MKVKLKVLMSSINALKEIAEIDTLDSAIAFRVARFIHDTQEIYTGFDTAKNKLVNRVGDKLEDGTFSISEKNKEEWNSEIEKLLEEEVDLSIPDLKESDFEKSSIKPIHISNLLWLIKE